MPLLRAYLPYCNTDKIFSAIFLSFSQLVTGWRDGRISFYCAPHFSPAHPSAPRRALYPSEHILIVRGLRARKLAARLAFTASPTRHTPSQANTAPPHRRMEGPDRAACRLHQPSL